jgi:hypothetical protein
MPATYLGFGELQKVLATAALHRANSGHVFTEAISTSNGAIRVFGDAISKTGKTDYVTEGVEIVSLQINSRTQSPKSLRCKCVR